MFYSGKINSLLAIAVAVLCSCSQVDEIDIADTAQEKVEDAKVVFRLKSNTTSVTRSTSTVEDSYEDPIPAYPAEYRVNTARVYFFNSATKLFAKSVNLTNIKESKTINNNVDMTYETDTISIAQGTYDIFVTANTHRQLNTETEDAFLADIDNDIYKGALIQDVSGGIVMSNRAVDNLHTDISGDFTEVTVLLERVLARLDLAKTADNFKYTINTISGSKDIATLTIDGYYIVNLPRYYYTFRHIAEIDHTVPLNTLEEQEPNWDLQTNFGDIKPVPIVRPIWYVTDPYFFKKTVDASNFTNAEGYYANYFGDIKDPDRLNWSSINTLNYQETNWNTAYSLENCSFIDAQKNAYSTGIIFRTTFEPNNNVYFLNNTGDLQLLTDKTSYPQELYYYDNRFFASKEALEKAVKEDRLSTANYQYKKFDKTDKGYVCYYKYWIRHLDNGNNNVMGVMEFAIVRNNLYRMKVTGITDMGEGTLEIIPDTPDEGLTKLQIEIDVKPWVVRNINIVL